MALMLAERSRYAGCFPDVRREAS